MNYNLLSIFGTTIFQSFASTLISVSAGLPLAHFIYSYEFRGRRILLALLPLLFIIPTKLIALGAMQLWGKGLSTIILSHCALNIPFAAYIFYAAYQKCNPLWNLVAAELGASPWQSYKDIYVPVIKPILLSAGITIFLLCFSTFLPMLLATQSHHISPDMLLADLYKANDTQSVMECFFMRMIIILPILYLYNRLPLLAGSDQPHFEYRTCYTIKKHSKLWLIGVSGIVIFIISPLIAAIIATMNLQVLIYLKEILLAVPDACLGLPILRVLFNSFMLALISACGAIMIGYFLSLITVRQGSSRYLGVFLVGLSFIIGSVGCGILFLWIANLYIPKFLIAVLCHIFLNFPFAYRIIEAQLRSYQSEWDYTAQSFGATHAKRVQTLQLPYLKTAFYQAWCIAFGLSLTEVGAGSICNDVAGMTMPMAIRLYREQGHMHAVMGMSIILLAMVFFVAYIGSLVVERRDS